MERKAEERSAFWNGGGTFALFLHNIMCLPAENFSDLRTPHRLSAFRDERSRFSIRVVRRIRPEAGFLNILHLIEFFSRQRKNKEKDKEQTIIQAENTKERRARASDPC